MSGYAELHCLSSYSFLRGAADPEALVRRAAKLGYAALAVTDECSVAGVVRAHLAAREAGLKLIVGSEFRLGEGRLVLLAANRSGYGDLCELITRARRAAPKGEYRVALEDFAGLADCLALLVPDAARDAAASARRVAELFPQRAWLAVELLRGPDDAGRLAALAALGRDAGLPLVAAGDVHMAVRGQRPLQDVVTAIRLGRPLAELGLDLHANGERHLRSLPRLAHLYPAPLLAETLAVARRCAFSLDELRYEYPQELVPAGATPASHLRALTQAGLRRRYPQGVPPAVRELAEHELALIAELAYEPYFLTVHDLVAYARGRGILCQGRGSAANSVVCYALGITEVDPGRMQMLFERFVSKERNEPPDIDVDFEHERREEVIQYLYARYGRERAALAAAVHCYRPRGALRDVGKALGFAPDEVDRLAKAIAWWDGHRIAPERLREAGFDPARPELQRLMALAGALVGSPRHLSQHSGGFVIARDRLTRLVPVENAAMPERTVIQWDKDDLDALGLLKVDVLALGMLSAIRRALDLIGAWRGTRLALADIPAEDPETYAMIRRADTVGVFQIESRAQMSMLPRLKPRCFYDLVIEVAIVRPGPIQGGMVHPYLARREQRSPVEYPSPAVREVLERTLGVPIFQEQVMRLAVVAAGFTPGEADQLRRSMAAWRRRGGLEPFERRLIDGMLARGYAEEFAQAIFRQIQGFGEYGFPESHAASFALLAYASAWLKFHEPAAFLCALLNAQPMGFYAPAQLVQDARRHGVEVRPADVLASDWESTLEAGEGGAPAVRLGLSLVKDLRREAALRLAALRRTGAVFDDLSELARRAGLDARDLAALARADALTGLSGHRRQALWAALGAPSRDDLLAPALRDDEAPPLAPPREGQEIAADYASLGLTLRRHPLALLRPRLDAMRMSASADIARAEHGRPVRTAGLVTCRQRPGTASGVTFLTLEDEHGAINVVVWRDLAERQRRTLLGARLLGVDGRVERQGEVVHVIAGRLVDYSRLLGRLAAASRDFR